MLGLAKLPLDERLEALRAKFDDEDFLKSNGLANEASIHIFPYDPKRELDVRAFTQRLVADSRDGVIEACVHERDLWDVFIQFCEQKLGPAWQQKMEDLEHHRGSDALLARMLKMANAEVLARLMDWDGHDAGKDVLLITGVGRAYPFVRLHAVLEACQPIFGDIPIVAMYPGVYTGHELVLFGRLNDGNYYRAFRII